MEVGMEKEKKKKEKEKVKEKEEKEKEIKPRDVRTIVGLLKDCARHKDVHGGSALHAHAINAGLLEKSPRIASAVISFYAKCGILSKARQVLHELPVQDVVSWSALIAGYAQHNRGHDALACFEHMQRRGIAPDEITFTCILKACAAIGAVDMGKRIHEEVASKGSLQNNIVLGTALVDMYAKCGALNRAQQVLESLATRNVVSWSALIAGYVQHGRCDEALDSFARMCREGISPNEFTFACILKACGSIRRIEKGEQIHDEIVGQGLLKKSIVLGTALVDMYAKCGELAKAELVLSQLPVRDTVSWNALISGHARQEHGTEILQFFSQMQREGLSPDVVTFICILKACGIVRDGDKGDQIHNEIINTQFLEKSVLLGSALVDMYAKCSMLEKAYKVLEELPVRDTVAWNTLIAGYALHERGHEALNCYVHMQRESLSPDEITFASLLKACGRIGAIDKGRQIHNEIAGAGLLQDNVMLGTALVDMYAKCGALAQAQKVLFRLPFQDTISWNALITGYSREGEFHDVLRCFRQMQKDGLIPNEVTFLCVLNACARTGKLDEAKMHYETMRTNYGITPKLEHHACMVVVFGCLGQFDKALSVIKAMPSLDDPSLWLALLNACKKWGNVEVGKLAFDQAIQLEKNLSAAYVLMANMCAAPGTKDSIKLVKMG